MTIEIFLETETLNEGFFRSAKNSSCIRFCGKARLVEWNGATAHFLISICENFYLVDLTFLASTISVLYAA